MPVVTNKRFEASTLQVALRNVGRFWQFLLQHTRPSQILAATVLTLLAGLTEGLALVLLLPLLHLLDSAASPTQSKAWLPEVLQSLGIQPNLVGILTIFLGLVAARSLVNRERGLYLCALELDFIRDVRVGLYSGIAHANWPFLRKMRSTDLLSALTAETDRLDLATHF